MQLYNLEDRTIGRILADKAATAVFYLISNCQRGLTGVSFGHFLIKQVAEEIARENARLSRFVTLSPVPNFAEWLKRERSAESSRALTPEDRAALAHLDTPGWWQTVKTRDAVEEPLLRAAAWYYLRARGRNGAPVDPVARFHLGNGARLERLNWLADVSEKGMEQSYGLMVNYLYELDDIEKNHEAYARQRTVTAASAVSRLVKGSARDVVPLAG